MTDFDPHQQSHVATAYVDMLPVTSVGDPTTQAVPSGGGAFTIAPGQVLSIVQAGGSSGRSVTMRCRGPYSVAVGATKDVTFDGGTRITPGDSVTLSGTSPIFAVGPYGAPLMGNPSFGGTVVEVFVEDA